MGLLNYITATSLDEDYAHASRRETPAARKRRPGRVGVVVLAAFGVLVATAAVQTARNADNAESSHEELVKQVIARKDQVAARRERVTELTREVRTLETQNIDATVRGRALQSRISSLGVLTGAEAVTGPGVVIVTDDGPGGTSKAQVLDEDLQRMVNGLWLAGAEAVAVDGQRVTNLTAVRVAGASITVNYEPISPPYRVTAIGNPDTLAARFVDTPGGQWWLDLQALYGVAFAINSEESLTLPAASRLTLRHAHVPETLR
jgi:uncharacterized protein YlxW (UPF0749 family)